MSPDHNPTPERFLIELEAVADPLFAVNRVHRNADYRLRVALKALLRGYGLRCRSVRFVTPTVADTQR